MKSNRTLQTTEVQVNYHEKWRCKWKKEFRPANGCGRVAPLIELTHAPSCIVVITPIKTELNIVYTYYYICMLICIQYSKIENYLFVSNSLILLNVYWASLTSWVADRQPSYLSAGMSVRWASRLLKQSRVTIISAPFLSINYRET